MSSGRCIVRPVRREGHVANLQSMFFALSQHRKQHTCTACTSSNCHMPMFLFSIQQRVAPPQGLPAQVHMGVHVALPRPPPSPCPPLPQAQYGPRCAISAIVTGDASGPPTHSIPTYTEAFKLLADSGGSGRAGCPSPSPPGSDATRTMCIATFASQSRHPAQ